MAQTEREKSSFGWSLVAIVILLVWPGVAAVRTLVTWREGKPEFYKLLGFTILGIVGLGAMLLSNVLQQPLSFEVLLLGGFLHLASAILFNRFEGQLRLREKAAP